MNEEQIKNEINTVIEFFDKIHIFEKKIVDIFGDSTNRSLMELIWNLFDKYLNKVSEKIGDEADWLTWFLFDNQRGDKKLTVIIDHEKFSVKDVDDLVQILRKS